MFPVERLAKPRVLFVIPGADEGSSMVFARRQAETLNQREAAEVENFYLKSRTSPVLLWREARRFRNHIRRFRPDLIHAHFGTMTALFSVLLAGRLPVVVTYRGSDLNVVRTARGLRPRLGRLFSQIAALRAKRVFCVSRGLRDRLWWNRNRASVLPSGVDTAIFRPMPRTAARQMLGWTLDCPLVLFNAGHDATNKRLDLALSAFDQVQHEIPAARMEVLDGKTAPDRMPVIMNAADCLLLTSDAEGSPTVVQEALATNLPIVSVDVGDVRERLLGIFPSAIVERDPILLARALVDILRSGERSNGRSRSEEICSRRIADELAQVYRELIARSLFKGATAWNTTLSSPPSRS